ncbi:uncharacterized protein FOBCDRAFT_236869 [Fusarium oxysporum Fo47]|uniref:uncharacterized protein n=1 Tax=Fusarium oxysporum Fo47 TaxID=660027 RepID=UPI0028698A63|nr:uncharacterized protein FOBCDRAFT_236869 [Fusarium oxysporum Fo47]QKD49454.2 hypothetical protein FOBCDRAFT_236869 [Fusarium oxysporum Fo47]
MEAIAGPAEESEWTLEDINMSHGDRLRYVAMPNDEYAAFLEWRESQKEQHCTLINYVEYRSMVYSTKARGLMEWMEAIPKHRKLGNFDINAVPLWRCWSTSNDRKITEMEVPAEKAQQHQVACFSCRASRQKCDRQDPCKPDSVEKLLARIEESGAREEVLTALLGQTLPSPNTTVSIRGTPWTHGQGTDSAPEHDHDTSQSSHSVTNRRSVSYDEGDDADGLVSPITMVTAAISMSSSAACDRLRSQMPMQPGLREAIMAPIKERLALYFASHRAQQKDWEVLATQAVDSPFKLERGTCDPLASRLIDDNDASLYFQLWCIAASVKSLSTIQAIIAFQYWAPLAARQADDPYWLTLSHAVQLAKEIGINRSDVVKEYVNAEFPNASPELTDRYARNYERAWLYTFIVDKGFGALNGRLQCMSWKAVPRTAVDWWKSPMAEPTDRIISGVIEIRGLLLQAMEKRRHIVSTPASILEWHREAYDRLTRVRDERCQPDDQPSSKYLPILAFYMDHSILVFNAQALRDLTASEDSATASALLIIQRKNIEVAGRMFDHLITDKTMNDVSVGFQNNQFIMICHAMTEILRVSLFIS